jgi:hypothetical protein
LAKYEVFIKSSKTKQQVQKKSSLYAKPLELRKIETPKYKKKEGRREGVIHIHTDGHMEYDKVFSIYNKKLCKSFNWKSRIWYILYLVYVRAFSTS